MLVAEGAAPLLLVHGQRDRRVPVEQSERLFAALTRARCECELLSLPGVGHVIGGRENLEQWLAAADRFFRKAAGMEARVGADEGSSGGAKK